MLILAHGNQKLDSSLPIQLLLSPILQHRLVCRIQELVQYTLYFLYSTSHWSRCRSLIRCEAVHMVVTCNCMIALQASVAQKEDRFRWCPPIPRQPAWSWAYCQFCGSPSSKLHKQNMRRYFSGML
ncbi:hypothetical protein M758_4G028500 [Ceratodon purpureus]|uniref:Uncharacterized protein n=1 Tax=Ceratodon purpureus TaxID=3225 RepID=A0A8T0I775_CERPU|nr:hypothetical protein KC19_4G032300 [Ceratodon purpureus]KAG0617965.1 hypothetical protein M758_4G028500 [Ceratodon purpureus]